MSNIKPGPTYIDETLLTKLAEIRELALTRATRLREHASPRTQSDGLWMSLALQELDVAHEELRVVEEELHTQADALSSAYSTLELELRYYRDLFESAPAAYFVTDVAGTVVEANHSACRLLGTAERFVIGKPLGSFVSEDDRLSLRNVLRLLVASDETTSFDLRVRPREGKDTVWVRASVQRTRDSSETAPRLRWILNEVPERRMRPPADPARASLERELASERQNRQEAERAVQRGHDVLAFVAHELRNPLTTTAGWLEILRREDVAIPSRDHVIGVLSRNVKALSRLVEELVDRTRIVQDEITLACEPTDLHALLTRVCDDARGMAQAKQQRFDCEIDRALGTIRCDPFRVSQVLNNIVGNALKFTPAGGVVQLAGRVVDDALECAVRDGGPGIAPEHLQTIFEPYIRVNAHGESTGLGLGLNIARRLVELHGGSICAESEGLGSGATFRMRLPLAGPEA